jgi:hypothetical protein
MGGQCTRVDSECRTTEDFVGFDPACEPNSRCCVPKNRDDAGAGGGTAGTGGGAGGGAADAGTCGLSATCWQATQACPNGTAQTMSSCMGTCCAPADTFCGNFSLTLGHCVDKGTMCGLGEAQLDPTVTSMPCPAGKVCCAVNNPP